MNEKQKPTFEQFSLYFDGLLPEDEKRQVEEYLQTNQSCKAMQMMEAIDAALQPDLSDEAIDQLLSNTVQEVHARIQQQVPRREGNWFFLLSPKFILTSALALLFVMAGISLIPWDQWSQGPQVASIDQEDTSFQIPSLDKVQEVAQGQALISMAQLAKKALDGGVDYVAKQSESSKDSFQGTSQTLVANAIKTVRSAQEPLPAPDQVSSASTEPSAAMSLASAGKTQLALGLGASVLQLVTVF